MGRSRSSAFLFAAAYITLIVGLFLALGGSAYAQTSGEDTPPAEETTTTPAEDEYVLGQRVTGVKVSATAGSDTASAEATQAEALPNTGLSLLGVVVIGGALVAGGLALRRREQRKS